MLPSELIADRTPTRLNPSRDRPDQPTRTRPQLGTRVCHPRWRPTVGAIQADRIGAQTHPEHHALRRWDKIDNLGAYARRATISNLIKSKQRGRDEPDSGR